MRSCQERLNHLLSYETSRKTIIQHWLVGVIHLSFLLAVGIYIFYYVMWNKQRYLKRYPVTGDFRYKLIPPEDTERTPLEDLPYCKKHVENSLELYENNRFVLNGVDNDDDTRYGALVGGGPTMTRDKCKKECVKADPRKPCIGLNFDKTNNNCYLFYKSTTSNMEDGMANEIIIREETDEWDSISKKKGIPDFLFHENIGNCTSGLKEANEKPYGLCAPQPGVQSGSFGIYLGYSRYSEKKNHGCECDNLNTALGHEQCYSNDFIYFPDIEKYRLEITHGYVTLQDLRRSDDDRLSMGSRLCNGSLVNQDGESIQEFTSGSTGAGTRDRITVKKILEAADIQGFDSYCDGHDDDCYPIKDKETSHSFRNEGLVVFLRIEYLDEWDREIRYTYKFDRMEDTDWSIYEGDKHYTALRIPVIITGSVGEFEFMNMIVEFTSTLFLLGMADLFMVYIVFKFFPQKDLYQRAIYQKTKTFEGDNIEEMKERRVSMWEDDHYEQEVEMTSMVGKKDDTTRSPSV